MLFLELLQHLRLLLVIAARQSLLLLSLIIHHLLDHASRLAIQVTQLAVLRRDLGRIDCGRIRDDVRPPLLPVLLVEVHADFLAILRRLERPGTVVDAHGLGEVALGMPD